MRWLCCCCFVALVAVSDIIQAAPGQPQGKAPADNTKGPQSGVLMGRGDGTACYKACSGHGVCKQYMCHCDVGYHGEDCATSYVDADGGGGGGGGGAGGQRVPLPVLSAGHFNVTSPAHHRRMVAATKGSTSGVAGSVLVLGYSGTACARCVVFEQEYADLATALRAEGVSAAELPVRTALTLGRITTLPRSACPWSRSHSAV